MSQLDTTRRAYLSRLLEENAIGPEELAYCLDKEPRVLDALLRQGSHLPISDTLARQVEQTFSKPPFWLDGEAENADNSDTEHLPSGRQH